MIKIETFSRKVESNMNNKKLIAFYLPQFHQIPENDEWWGKGFTEWSNTKKGVPLFAGQIQPKEPLNDNYYCLLDKDTQVWQAELAKKYGIYGFCYYHYWFSGKLLLEKPMENMLENKSIDIPFCISWANESWSRAWDGREQEVLIKQEYGEKEDWESHFQYLLPFFKDKRYICVDQCPVILLYSAIRIEKCEDMIKYWKKRAKEEGFPDLHIVETLNGVQTQHVLNNSNADVIFEPIYSLTHELKKSDLFSKAKRYLNNHFLLGKLRMENGKETYKIIENRKYPGNRETYLGTFPSWDNTARKGKRGVVFRETSPRLFETSLRNLYGNTEGGDFIFINAWNEWGEGAYLEPDKENEFQYLEHIKNVVEESDNGEEL